MSSAARASSVMACRSGIERVSSTVPPRAVNTYAVKNCAVKNCAVKNSAVKKPRRLQRQPEEMPADHLEDRKLRLRLLRHRVHIAEAPLERIAFKNCGGPGGEISHVGDLTGLLAGMDRGHAQPHALIECDGIVLRGA